MEATNNLMDSNVNKQCDNNRQMRPGNESGIVYTWHVFISGIVARGGTFWAVIKFSRPKAVVQNAKFELKPPILRKFGSKIKILSTHNILSWKCPAVYWKIATSCPAYFLTHDAADVY